MNTTEEISIALQRLQGITEIENGARVNTHCLYPGSSFVRVTVLGSGDTFTVSDDAGAFREAEQAGATLDFSDKKFSKTLHAQGLQMRNGVIFSGPVSREMLPLAIAMVANASKETADWIFEHWNFARGIKFKDLLKSILKVQFPDVQEQHISGVSNKSHIFENVIQLKDGKRLLIDAVVRDSNSVNARVVANLDVKRAAHARLEQAIVYDDAHESWGAADLSLLAVSGVPVIPFSKSNLTFQRVSSEGFHLAA